eukprot:CAMPEP_0184655886 /NCGR_PEP_ID=MMETSP0308-20130426/14823_1 /TAXON_ID=38269 /ORGANISM="Gloeochaete witrockiana, Strain SAG 46.84" /LENGTH=147 /DNA_ID=CAMNT_0027092695 /DNA_START=163 /DNA_END=606 /DNA_ORIENTATION=+
MRDAAEVMSKYLGNVLSHEGEDKFRHIRIGNPIFQQRVAAATGATGVLIATGFKQVFVHSPCFGQNEDFLELPAEYDVLILKRAKEALDRLVRDSLEKEEQDRKKAIRDRQDELKRHDEERKRLVSDINLDFNARKKDAARHPTPNA